MTKRSQADAAASSRAESGVPEDADAGALEAESIGHYLSQQRRLRGISVAQLAELTRIPVRSIERLEAGHFDHDSDGFVRGFVRTVSEALGLDPEDALARMLAEPHGEPDSGRPISLLAARSLVGLVAVVALVLAIGLVRSVLDSDGLSAPALAEPDTVWRHDPVRALAEANAARYGGAPPPPPSRTPSSPRRVEPADALTAPAPAAAPTSTTQPAPTPPPTPTPTTTSTPAEVGASE